MTSTLNTAQLQQLFQDLAEIAQHYNQSSADSLLLRQYKVAENEEEVLYVVGEDEQGKECITIKVTLIHSSAENSI